MDQRRTESVFHMSGASQDQQVPSQDQQVSIQDHGSQVNSSQNQHVWGQDQHYFVTVWRLLVWLFKYYLKTISSPSWSESTSCCKLSSVLMSPKWSAISLSRSCDLSPRLSNVLHCGHITKSWPCESPKSRISKSTRYCPALRSLSQQYSDKFRTENLLSSPVGQSHQDFLHRWPESVSWTETSSKYINGLRERFSTFNP